MPSNRRRRSYEQINTDRSFSAPYKCFAIDTSGWALCSDDRRLADSEAGMYHVDLLSRLCRNARIDTVHYEQQPDSLLLVKSRFAY